MAKAAKKKTATRKKASSRRGVERVFTKEERAAVRNFILVGIPQTRIAQILDCSFNTLKKHCSQEIEYGLDIANAQVAGATFENATTLMNFQAQKYWLACKAGWREDDQNTDKPPGVLNINLFPTAAAE